MFFNKNELNSLYADECMYCGEMIVEWAYLEYQDKDDIFNFTEMI